VATDYTVTNTIDKRIFVFTTKEKNILLDKNQNQKQLLWQKINLDRIKKLFTKMHYRYPIKFVSERVLTYLYS